MKTYVLIIGSHIWNGSPLDLFHNIQIFGTITAENENEAAEKIGYKVTGKSVVIPTYPNTLQNLQTFSAVNHSSTRYTLYINLAQTLFLEELKTIEIPQAVF